jgi:sphinganine-1-phosphate aldolase
MADNGLAVRLVNFFVRNQSRFTKLEHLITITAITYAFLRISKKGFVATFKDLFWSILLKAPGAKGAIKGEQDKAIKELKTDLSHDEEALLALNWKSYEHIPAKGLSSESVLQVLKSIRNVEKEYNGGAAFGGIYGDLEEQEEVLKQAYGIFFDSNGFYPRVFPTLRQMENEVVKMTINLLHGNDKCVGVMTNGGTESILLAVKAYKERAKDIHGITEPELLASIAVHPAVKKACDYFGVKFVEVPLASNLQIDINALKAAINKNTILIVGSAPTFPHGVIDDIETLGQLGLKHNIPVHVDACVGAFLLPWLEKLGHLNRKWDYRVPGVTSISADTHKYGFGPKGTSVICYSDAEYRKYQFFATTYWAGGFYVTPSVSGSRAGGLIASAWAGLVHMGEDGYLKGAQEMHRLFEELKDGINNIPGLRVIGPPEAANIAFVADHNESFDIMKVADALETMGWKNSFRLRRPNGLLIQVGVRSKFDAQKYLDDLKKAVQLAKTHPEEIHGLAKIYKDAALAPAPVVEGILAGYADALYQ